MREEHKEERDDVPLLLLPTAASHPKRTNPGPAWFPLPTGAHLSRATPDETAVADWWAPVEAYFP